MLRTSEFILNFILNSFWQIAAIFAIAGTGVLAAEEWLQRAIGIRCGSLLSLRVWSCRC